MFASSGGSFIQNSKYLRIIERRGGQCAGHMLTESLKCGFRP